MKLIDCSTKKYPDSFAMVDDEDFSRLSAWKWYTKKSKVRLYAVRNRRKGDGPGKTLVRMHREVMGLSESEFVDHQDGNGLNNCKENLRDCTEAENNRNLSKCVAKTSSIYKGVSFHSKAGKFVATIMLNRQHHYLGIFKTESQAAEAYDVAAKKLHGDFAKINLV